MKNPAVTPKKTRSTTKSDSPTQAGAMKGKRKSPCTHPVTASANVRAPQGIAALTSAAMLAAVQPAARTAPQAVFSLTAARLEPNSQKRFTLRNFLQRAMQWVRRCCQRVGAHLPGQPLRGRTLQLVEMQSLGEKRFVAVLRVGTQRFLIGGAAGSVQMLGEVGEQGTTVISPRPQRREKA